MTQPFLWLMLGGAFLGLGLAWATRWKPQARRLRGWLVPWGFNFSVASLLAAVLVSGTGPSGLGAVPLLWAEVFGLAATVGLLVFRFPRAVGLPLLLVLAGTGGYLAMELRDYQPLENPARAAEVRLLTETDQVRRFEVRLSSGSGRMLTSEQELAASEWPLSQVDALDLPVWSPWPVHRFVRFVKPAVPPGWGFSLVPDGWKSLLRAQNPVPAERLALYRLDLSSAPAVWVRVTSALAP